MSQSKTSIIVLSLLIKSLNKEKDLVIELNSVLTSLKQLRLDAEVTEIEALIRSLSTGNPNNITERLSNLGIK